MNQSFLLIIIFMLSSLLGCNGQGLVRDNFQVGTSADGSSDANGIKREANSILVKPDFCACQNGEQVIYGNCAATCASKTAVEPTFFGSVNVTEGVSLGYFGDLDGWCNKADFSLEVPIGTAIDEAPSCSLVFEKASTGETVKTTVTVTGNDFKAVLPDLDEEVTYRAYLQFEGTGENNISGLVPSSKIQLKLLPDPGAPILTTPLQVALINRYTCIKAAYVAGPNSSVIYNDQALKQYYFYAPSYDEPTPIPSGTVGFYCHDIQDTVNYPLPDRVTYPRLDLAPGAFTVWNRKDSRFFDLYGNESGSTSDDNMDIYNLIINKLGDLGVTISGGVGSLSASNLFARFNGAGDPVQVDSDDAGLGNEYFGYYMQPQINTTTKLSFCPGTAEYNGTNPFFNVLGDIFNQIETEGLYMGQQVPDLVLTDQNGNAQQNVCWPFVYLTETELKRVWFYLENGIATPADENTVQTKKVYFYWPLTPENGNPLVKQGDQKIFELKLPSEIASACGAAVTEDITVLPPHDKKIGCIPKSN